MTAQTLALNFRELLSNRSLPLTLRLVACYLLASPNHTAHISRVHEDLNIDKDVLLGYLEDLSSPEHGNLVIQKGQEFTFCVTEHGLLEGPTERFSGPNPILTLRASYLRLYAKATRSKTIIASTDYSLLRALVRSYTLDPVLKVLPVYFTNGEPPFTVQKMCAFVRRRLSK